MLVYAAYVLVSGTGCRGCREGAGRRETHGNDELKTEDGNGNGGEGVRTKPRRENMKTCGQREAPGKCPQVLIETVRVEGDT